MNRATNAPVTRSRRKEIGKESKGSFGPNTFKIAKERRMRALSNAYIGRKQRKRFFRSDVWIPRLNAELRSKYGLRYSQFIHLLMLAPNKLSRKRLSEIALNQPQNFAVLVKKIQKKPWQPVIS